MNAFLILILSTLSLPAFSAPKCGPSDSSIEKLQEYYATTLKYNSLADRECGGEVLDQVERHFSEFTKSYKKNPESDAQFKKLVSLIAAALPYDEEMGLAEDLANAISDSKALRGIYPQALKEIKDKCRGQILAASIKEKTCILKNEANESRDSGKTCTPTADYKCLGPGPQ